MSVLRVLLVDDEEDLVNPMVERLRLRGVAADGVLTGNDAIARVAENEYDVVVLDLKMPGFSGHELLARIKQTRPNIPVIVMTGHSAIRNGEQAVKEDAYDYLVKPFDI
ncbi:response regulator, partial [Candidatus Sumerlaeota bacterium]|nr:response regulator [Candidatus Sumerlaeota bacterium]